MAPWVQGAIIARGYISPKKDILRTYFGTFGYTPKSIYIFGVCMLILRSLVWKTRKWQPFIFYGRKLRRHHHVIPYITLTVIFFANILIFIADSDSKKNILSTYFQTFGYTPSSIYIFGVCMLILRSVVWKTRKWRPFTFDGQKWRWHHHVILKRP